MRPGDLQDAAKRLGLAPGLRRYQIVAAWETVVGAVMALQTRPTSTKGDILFVRTSGPLWSQEVSMRKNEILDKLNRLLPDQELRQLRCRVGAIEVAPAPPGQPAPEDWTDYPLGPNAQARVERVLATVEEPTLRATMRRVLEQVERRKVWAIRVGMRPCCLCGQFQEAAICRGCQMERRRNRLQRLYQVLGNRPWVTLRELQVEFPDLLQTEFLQARQKLRSIYERNYRIGRESLPAGKPFPPGLRQIMLDMTMLSTGVEVENLSSKHVYYTFGKVWGGAYLKDCVPDMEALRAEWQKKGIRWKDGRLVRPPRPKVEPIEDE